MQSMPHILLNLAYKNTHDVTILHLLRAGDKTVMSDVQAEAKGLISSTITCLVYLLLVTVSSFQMCYASICQYANVAIKLVRSYYS